MTRLNFAPGRPRLGVSREPDGLIAIYQERYRIRITDSEALRIADSLVDAVEARA